MRLPAAIGLTALIVALARPSFAQELAYTVKPELQNRTEIKSLVDSVTARLFADGRETRTVVWAKVLIDGRTSEVSVRDASGDTARDNFAVRVVKAMRWSPAKNSKGVTETWIAIPVVIGGDAPQRRGTI